MRWSDCPVAPRRASHRARSAGSPRGSARLWRQPTLCRR